MIGVQRARRSRRATRARNDGHVEPWLEFDTDFVPVHVLTEDGIIAGTNRAFNELFGTRRSELVGKHQAALNNLSVATNLELMQEIRRQIAATGSWRGTLTNRDPQGAEFTSRAHIYPMRCGGIRRLVCFQQPRLRAVRRFACESPVEALASPVHVA